jgi:hypothetical protein
MAFNDRSSVGNILNSHDYKLKYLLTFLAIGQCGIGFLGSKEVYIFALVILVGVMLTSRRSLRAINVLPWASANLLIYVLQSISFDAFDVSIVQLLYFYIRLIVPALYLAVIGVEFHKYYIKIIYYYAVISLFFWGIELLIPPLGQLLRGWAIRFSQATGSFVVDYKNISLFLLYTFTTMSKFHTMPRNSGPFWEPGAFAVYLAVALVFLYLHTKTVRNKHVAILTVAMITTQSTAGYVSLFLFWSWVILDSNSRYKLFIFVLLALGSYFFFESAPFMNQKITEMYETQSEQDLSGFTSGRFYSARKSINAIWQHPFIGRGISRRTAYDEYSEFYGAYGIINVPSRFGLIMGSVYFILLFASLKRYSSLRSSRNLGVLATSSFIILLPVYFSQGVYLSVVNLMILQSVLVFDKFTNNQNI